MPEWLIPVITGAAAWGGAWGAVRADVRSIRERMTRVEDAVTAAHQRIDSIIQR